MSSKKKQVEKARSRRRATALKVLCAKPTIKNVDIEAIKRSFEEKKKATA